MFSCPFFFIYIAELLEEAEAILTSYCVILTFSMQEQQGGSVRFLQEVCQLRPGRCVVFVRCRDNDNDQNENAGNVGMDESMTAFKILEWPGAPSDVNTKNVAVRDRRSKEKFWCNLRKNLPGPAIN